MKTENNHLRSVLNLPFLILNCLLYFLLIPQPVFGQGDMGARQSFAQAESEYQIGRIDNAITIVNANVSRYDGTLKSGAYRLLALCYLAQDNIEEANRYVDLLLQEDPYYSITVNDPERFAELIRDKKEGKTTIVTASQQSETLEEAPVPVTLITEEMIKAIGARTLKDVLLAYVPGITSVESPNEVNVAMHGVYSAGQEKILIMINGQRMNARATNKAAPDYPPNQPYQERYLRYFVTSSSGAPASTVSPAVGMSFTLPYSAELETASTTQSGWPAAAIASRSNASRGSPASTLAPVDT